jgi:tripartite-type tricarboxylate transporter receptor subunit TctC
MWSIPLLAINPDRGGKSLKLVRLFPLTVCAACALGAAPAALAQSHAYPTKIIRLIVGFPPGGATDITARLVGQKMAASLGQNILIDNRPGANSNIGTEAAARAAPDGYTLLMCTIASTINHSLYKNLPFDLLKDFTPVTQTTSVQSFLAIHPSLPVRSVKELIALAKAKPGTLNFASSGTGGSPHLAGEMFKLMAGVDMVHVPYKGTAPELNDLLAGNVKIAFETTPALLPHVKEGKLIALAVNSAKRTPLLPNVPTMAEAGLAGFEMSSWNGLLVPARTPKAIVTRLHKEAVQALQAPEVSEKLSGLGADPVGSAPEQFAAFMQAETKKWARVIREANIKAE